MTQKLLTRSILLVLAMSLPSPASAKPCKKQSIQDLVTAWAESFVAKKMGELDADRPFAGAIRLVIEHTLADDNDPDRFEIKKFSSFERMEKWFKSHEIDGMPGRNTRPIEKCAKGVCTYNTEGGLNHNNLYLKKITYRMRGGCAYIKTIYLLDGD